MIQEKPGFCLYAEKKLNIKRENLCLISNLK